MKKNLSNSARKYIRTQKSLIRRQFSDIKKQEELISNLYNKSTDVPAVKEVKKEEAPKPKKEKPKKEHKKDKVEKK